MVMQVEEPCSFHPGFCLTITKPVFWVPSIVIIYRVPCVCGCVGGWVGGWVWLCVSMCVCVCRWAGPEALNEFRSATCTLQGSGPETDQNQEFWTDRRPSCFVRPERYV